MIISRREWEEKCDSNRALLKDKAEKTELIEKFEKMPSAISILSFATGQFIIESEL